MSDTSSTTNGPAPSGSTLPRREGYDYDKPEERRIAAEDAEFEAKAQAILNQGE